MESIVEAVYVLDGGAVEVEASLLVPDARFGTRVAVPVQMFVLETRLGCILIDGGNDPVCVTDPEKAWGKELAEAVVPHMTDQNHPYAQLALLGLGPSDIKMVIYTHLHHDHCGAARFFPDAVHVVQQAEHRYAFKPDRFAGGIYLRSDFGSPEINWRLIDGDLVILPGVHLLSTPGHSPGHQSVVLWNVPEVGTIIISGDAVYCRENIERDVPPGIAVDNVEAMRSIHRLTALARATDASLFVSHDPVAFATVAKAPDPLGRMDVAERRFYLEGIRTLYGSNVIDNFLGQQLSTA